MNSEISLFVFLTSASLEIEKEQIFKEIRDFINKETTHSNQKIAHTHNNEENRENGEAEEFKDDQENDENEDAASSEGDYSDENSEDLASAETCRSFIFMRIKVKEGMSPLKKLFNFVMNEGMVFGALLTSLSSYNMNWHVSIVPEIKRYAYDAKKSINEFVSENEFARREIEKHIGQMLKRKAKSINTEIMKHLLKKEKILHSIRAIDFRFRICIKDFEVIMDKMEESSIPLHEFLGEYIDKLEEICSRLICYGRLQEKQIELYFEFMENYLCQELDGICETKKIKNCEEMNRIIERKRKQIGSKVLKVDFENDKKDIHSDVSMPDNKIQEKQSGE